MEHDGNDQVKEAPVPVIENEGYSVANVFIQIDICDSAVCNNPHNVAKNQRKEITKELWTASTSRQLMWSVCKDIHGFQDAAHFLSTRIRNAQT